MNTRGGLVALVLAASSVGCHSSSPSANAGPPGSCSIATPTLSDWRLHADGALFRDSANRVVFLRGVDAGGRSKFAPYVPFDFPDGGYATSLAAYMDRAASWGINAMRVPFTWAALEPMQGQDDAELALDVRPAPGRRVGPRHLHRRGLPPGRLLRGLLRRRLPRLDGPRRGPSAPRLPELAARVLQRPSMQAAFDTFWDAASPVQAAYLSAWDVMIARYKDKPGVLGFEPINEPGWGTSERDHVRRDDAHRVLFDDGPAHAREAPSSLVFVDPPGVDGDVRLDDARKADGRRHRLRAPLLPAVRRRHPAARRPRRLDEPSADSGTSRSSSASSARATSSYDTLAYMSESSTRSTRSA